MGDIVGSADFRRPGLATKGIQLLGLMPRRNLYWSWYEPRNFGDWVGPYLYQAMLGQRPFHLKRKHHRRGECFFTAGSILRDVHVPDMAIVWGSGIISADDRIARPKKVLAVRGPRSRKRLRDLGYSCPEVFGDPAVLLSRFYEPRTQKTPGRIGLIPHFFDYEQVKAIAAKDVFVINVSKPVDEVIDDIATCELTFSSSLHGLIVSHTYGVPTVWHRSMNKLIGDDSKFFDYFESVGLPKVAPAQISSASSAQELRFHAGLATSADLDDMRTGLLACCPFLRPAA